jgi:hypothetical protein
MSSIRVLLSMLVVGASVACAEILVAPSPDGLTGRWSADPMPLSPTGQLFRTLEFSADGRFVRTSIMRGVYAQQPAGAVASTISVYGKYSLARDTIRFVQDSLRGWDYMSGEYVQIGPGGVAIEGPPTDPAVELTPTHLTLRYMVNPGAGYVPVVEDYSREP